MALSHLGELVMRIPKVYISCTCKTWSSQRCFTARTVFCLVTDLQGQEQLSPPLDKELGLGGVAVCPVPQETCDTAGRWTCAFEAWKPQLPQHPPSCMAFPPRRNCPLLNPL